MEREVWQCFLSGIGVTKVVISLPRRSRNEKRALATTQVVDTLRGVDQGACGTRDSRGASDLVEHGGAPSRARKSTWTCLLQRSSRSQRGAAGPSSERSTSLYPSVRRRSRWVAA